tara:strand:+ start:660 stop:761 length:102 start_codon:yes stop_codon:yes gene_type:complete
MMERIEEMLRDWKNTLTGTIDDLEFYNGVTSIN